jgi:leader peptidase (prepilin peptidase) / N-methyltransferase
MELLIPTLLLGSACDYGLIRRFHPIRYPCTVILSLALYAILWKTFDNRLLIVKGLIFAQLLIFAGYSDAKTQEIPDFLSALILLDGLILFQPISSICGFFVVSLPLFILAKMTGGGVGGGDIKLMAACGFVLGTDGVVAGTMISMIVFLIVYLIYYRKKRNKMYAMAPFFGIGCFLAYLLIT